MKDKKKEIIDYFFLEEEKQRQMSLIIQMKWKTKFSSITNTINIEPPTTADETETDGY